MTTQQLKQNLVRGINFAQTDFETSCRNLFFKFVLNATKFLLLTNAYHTFIQQK